MSQPRRDRGVHDFIRAIEKMIILKMLFFIFANRYVIRSKVKQTIHPHRARQIHVPESFFYKGMEKDGAEGEVDSLDSDAQRSGSGSCETHAVSGYAR